MTVSEDSGKGCSLHGEYDTIHLTCPYCFTDENGQLWQSAVKERFLREHVFHGLTNLNDGFDASTIAYFSTADFRTVLNRVEQLGIGIHAIEPWLDGTFYDVAAAEDYSADPTDPKWYNTAFEAFIAQSIELQYAASYFIPAIENPAE